MVQVELALQLQASLPSPDDVLDQAADPAVVLSGSSHAQWQQYFAQWLTHLCPPIAASPIYELSLVFTCDAEIQQLNATYRHQDQPTDVLAFAALEWEGPPLPDGSDEPIQLGDIVISLDTAARQAKEQGYPLSLELMWLSCHGLLHLLGWDHPDAAQLERMLTQQSELMALVGVQAPVWSTAEFGYLH